MTIARAQRLLVKSALTSSNCRCQRRIKFKKKVRCVAALAVYMSRYVGK